ncbi:hypothetical protein QJS10_CPB14g00410 [Acorus calamus]|uniref:Uncharacterized protein n=1 Tax=Acorus calamus TaxID=4465 RepID=A0AAV9DBW8_ACOCL|nr:hypothetical protein QJS10_CPB14g00410 [Acorus calamus]
MCLKLFWSKNSSTDSGRHFSHKKPNKPPSRDRDDIEKVTSTYNPNNPYNESPPKSDYVPSLPPSPPPPPQKKPHSKPPPPPLVPEETHYPTKGGGGYINGEPKSEGAAYDQVSESATTLKGVHGVVGERHFN